MARCFSCQKELSSRIGRQERCQCGADLHCCYNCLFYDSTAYNECREPQAERVLDKERANFCDYFQLAERPFSVGQKDAAAEAKKKLEELFRKKP